MSDMDPERDLTMDAYRIAWAIKFAAVLISVSVLLLGLMVWQPWASPSRVVVQDSPYSSNGKACVTYKWSVDCG